MSSNATLTWRKPALKAIDTSKVVRFEEEAANGEPLSPSARMFHEPNFNVYVMAIMASEKKIDLDVVRGKFPDTMLKHPRFSSLQVVDEKTKEMKWVPTKVNLNDHIIVPEVDELSLPDPEKFVEDYVSSLTKTTIDMRKPLWEIHILNVSAAEAEAFAVWRIHHSLGDGTSLMSLLLASCRQSANPGALPTLPMQKRRPINAYEPKGWEFNPLRWVWRLVVSLWFVLHMMWNSVVDMLMFALTFMFLNDTWTPLTSPPGVENLPRRFIWRTVNLDDMKLIKNAMNTTINDVALGVTQAALSKYLNRKFGGNLPKKIRLRSTLLINLRPTPGIQALADLMEKGTEASWGNWIGYVLLPFTIGLRDDPLDYVREAQATANRKKRSLEAIWTFTLAEVILKLFGIKRASKLSHRIITHTTLCFSNLVGPVEEVEFHGHPMAYLAPSSFNQPHALMINFQSYVNKMTVVLSLEESTITDGEQLLDDIADSLKLIKDAVNAKYKLEVGRQ